MSKAKANGSTGPQIKRRTAWVALPDEYEGFEVEIWVNAPTRLWTQLGSGEEAEALEAMQRIVIGHNGWLDFDGNPYPPADDSKLWEEVPTELAAVVLAIAQAEITKLPNSLAPTNRRSRRG